MKKSQKKIVNAAVFVLLAYFVTRPMYYPGVGYNPKPRRISVQLQPQGRIVSFGEMDNFLNVWSEFLEQSFSSEDMPAMLTAETAYGKKLSSRAQRWIKAQGWDADRFFYTGRRLRSAVKACRLKALAQQTRESLEIQLEQTEDPDIRNSIKKLMAEQGRMYLAENVSESEIEMVMPHLNVVSDILDGKLIYRPKRKK